jgi:peptidyl-dipeptidase Dcp
MKILTTKFNTKYDTAFSKIKNEDFLPAFIEGIALAKAEIDSSRKRRGTHFQKTRGFDCGYTRPAF